MRLSDGPAIDAVLAAAAIPGVLPPVRWRSRLLVDGGIADNTPISHAVALGARRIYVLPTANPGDRGLPRPPRAAVAAAVHAITLLTNARLQDDLARYTPAAELIVLPALNPQHIPPTDFGHAGQLITQALAAAREALTVGSAQAADGGHSPRRDVARPDRPARRPLWRRPRARPGAFRATAARGSRRRPGCCGAGAGGVLPGWRASRPSRSSGQTGDASAGHGRAPSARPMADIGHAGVPEASGMPLMPSGRTQGPGTGLGLNPQRTVIGVKELTIAALPPLAIRMWVAVRQRVS